MFSEIEAKPVPLNGLSIRDQYKAESFLIVYTAFIKDFEQEILHTVKSRVLTHLIMAFSDCLLIRFSVLNGTF